MNEGVAGAGVPHDLVHLVVERRMRDDTGFWGAVAAGAVFGSMEHLDGRRPPHAADRSRRAIRARADRLTRAELMAGLVEQVIEHRLTTVEQVRKASRETLSVLPDARVDEQGVLAAAAELCGVAREWAELSPGEELVVDWPERRPARRPPRA
ncbi:hypothetical protein [Streptomyces sp. NPDC059398]|uniref:hypothetical protein n=1 Tax=Streptomyces sp. NPDC059398 TaxID=3346820 RepID=UPI0036C4E2D4